MMKRLDNRGFTLIKLLIVIVIIGILAGVVIGVLNPVEQQARAKDGTLKSTLSKMALSTKSLYVSSSRSTNKAPTGPEFMAGVGNFGAGVGGNAAACDGVGNIDTPAAAGSCQFQISGVDLPDDCNGEYNGTGTDACNFSYYRSGEMFTIFVKNHANPRALLAYHFDGSRANNAVFEAFYECTGTAVELNAATDPASVANSGCTVIQ